MLEASDKICALNDVVTNLAIVLITPTRAAFIMQQVERDVLAMCRGIMRTGIATSPKNLGCQYQVGACTYLSMQGGGMDIPFD